MRTIVLCDDVAGDRARLREILEDYFWMCAEEVILKEYSSGTVLVSDVEEGYLEMNVLFLDAVMAGIDGMETARRLRENGYTGSIIFLTVSRDYAVESYEVGAAGYLMKPVKEQQITALLDRIWQPDIRRSIEIKSNRKVRHLYTDDIIYADSDRHRIMLHMADGTVLPMVDKLGNLQEKIAEDRFLRCHQSYLVNLDYVKSATEDFILTDGTRIPIRVRRRKEMIDAYDDYAI